MKILKTTSLLLFALTTMGVIYAFTFKTNYVQWTPPKRNQNMNLFVTHGHCSSPFSGQVENFDLQLTQRYDQGNPMEGAKVQFDINPATFTVCADRNYADKLQASGLFWTDNAEKITFKSTEIYTTGMDWYQINGNLTIKGVERKMKFFVSGIRAPQQQMATQLIFEGQINLMDYGIDYDQIVYGKTMDQPTQWMHFNMQVRI